jgi:hypothetical protein
MGLESPEWIDFVEKHGLPLSAKEAWALYCVHEMIIITHAEDAIAGTTCRTL